MCCSFKLRVLRATIAGTLLRHGAMRLHFQRRDREDMVKERTWAIHAVRLVMVCKQKRLSNSGRTRSNIRYRSVVAWNAIPEVVNMHDTPPSQRSLLWPRSQHDLRGRNKWTTYPDCITVTAEYIFALSVVWN